MKESNRKFIFGKLEIRKFVISDYLYLASFTIAVAYYFYVLQYAPENKFAVSWIISSIIGFQTISSAFGIRFRNISFSTIWLSISILLLIDNYFTSLIPLLTFILYHIIRMIFWKKNNREFIPYETGKGNMYRHKSQFEGKYGDLRDKKYTKLLLWVGMLIMLIMLLCFIQVIKSENLKQTQKLSTSTTQISL